MVNVETSKAILRGDPIEWKGLTLYPIQVSEYMEFNGTKEGIVLSQQTLPLKYAGMLYLEALFALDLDCVSKGEEKPGLFSRCMQFLALAMRLPSIRDEQGRTCLPIQFKVDSEDHSKLVSVKVQQGETVVNITPMDFNDLRPLLAEMNGLELPNEAHNAELEEAERDIAAAGAADVDANMEDLVYAVAVQTGTDVRDVWSWSMRQFFKTRDAIDRGLGYQLAYLATAAGAKYPKGNPWPSWAFQRKKGLSAALIPMGQFSKQVGGTVESRP